MNALQMIFAVHTFHKRYPDLIVDKVEREDGSGKNYNLYALDKNFERQKFFIKVSEVHIEVTYIK